MRNIVYIVGAGLTKALENKKRIPLMDDFVSVMADYLIDDNGTCDNVILNTLAGLEVDSVFECENIEGKELATLLIKARQDPFHKGLTSKQLGRLREIARTRPHENIEKLLQRTIELNKNKDSLLWYFSPDQFNFAINQVFSHIGWDVNLNCLDEFLIKQFQLADTKHTFISFNYDLTLDRSIQEHSPLKWDVKNGYGFEINRFITVEEATAHMGQFKAVGGAYSFLHTRELVADSKTDTCVKILKPHGSLNWLLGFEGNYEFIDATPILCLNEDQTIAHYPLFNCQALQLVDGDPWDKPDEKLWSHAGLYLVPPAKSKYRNIGFINSIRDQEAEAYKSADEMFVIGWSMPQTDNFQVDIIEEHLQKRDKPLERVIAINKNEGQSYYNKVAQVFGVSEPNLSIHNEGFCDYVSDFTPSHRNLFYRLYDALRRHMRPLSFNTN